MRRSLSIGWEGQKGPLTFSSNGFWDWGKERGREESRKCNWDSPVDSFSINLSLIPCLLSKEHCGTYSSPLWPAEGPMLFRVRFSFFLPLPKYNYYSTILLYNLLSSLLLDEWPPTGCPTFTLTLIENQCTKTRKALCTAVHLVQGAASGRNNWGKNRTLRNVYFFLLFYKLCCAE